MQNSYGRLEQSYMKCSPIFPGMTSDSREKDQNSELIQNFPLSSMLQNKTAVIRSNFDINADMMTPYYKRANHLEDQEENEIAESQEEDGFISELREAPVHQKEKNSLTTRTSQRTNQNQQGVSLNSSLFGGVRASNSAFLLNYQANTKTVSKHFDSGPGNIQNSFSHIYSNLNNNFNGLKPHSSIFLGKNMESQKNAPVNLTIINNNNYNMQNFQPKIREVIKIAGYEKNKKNKINKKSGNKPLNSKTSKLKKVNRKFENEKIIKQKGKIRKKINENDDVSMISSNFDYEEKEYSEIIQSDQDESATEEKESLDNKKKEGTRKQKKKNIPKVEEKTEIVLPSNRIEKSRKNLSNKKKKANNNNIKIKSLLDNDQVKSDIEMLSSEVEENLEYSDSEEGNESSLEESKNSEQIQSEYSDQEEEISGEDDYVSNSLQRTSKQDFFSRKKKSYLQKKTKSIRDLVDSTKKIIEEKRPKGRKQTEEEKEKVYVFNNIETNKYTKKIAQDTFNRNFPNIHYKKGDNDSSSAYAGLNNLKDKDQTNISYSSNQVLTRKKEDKIFTKSSKVKLKRSKKSTQTRAEITMIEKDPVTIKDVEYLLEDIEETPELNGSCSFFNPLIKNEYLQYMTRGKSNESKLTFGRNPLVIYQELTDWLLKEKKKLEEDKPENLQNTTDFCAKIQNEMNGISKFTSSLPVIKMPDDHRKQSRKRKKINQSLNEEDKKFKCEVCAKEGRDQYFETGQGLGGHMSRVHKGKSDKFNKKKEIRNNREDFRKILQEAKIKMLRDRDLDYEYLMKSKEGKLKVKNFIKDNREKYRKLVRELRRNKRPSRIQN